MFFVYFLRSLNSSDKTYVGFSTDITQRLKIHNAGGSIHTQKYKPWIMVSYLAFDCEEKARDFEIYIKKGSGYAFAKKRIW